MENLTEENIVEIKNIIKDLQIYSIEKESINNNINTCFDRLKELGCPKKIILKVLKDKKTPPEELEMETMQINKIKQILGII